MKVDSGVRSMVRMYAKSFSFVAAALFLFSFATPQANASTLGTIEQSIVTTFLTLLGSDQTTVQNVAAVLAAADIQSSLTVSTDTTSPAYSPVAGGTAGVTLGRFTFHATGEAVILQAVQIMMDDVAAVPADVSQVYLYDGSLLVGTATFLPDSSSHLPMRYVATSTLLQSVAIAKDSDKTLTIKADIAPVGVNQGAQSGDLIQLGIGGATGIGQLSGKSVSLSFNNQYPFAAYGVRIFKSFPLVELGNVSAPGTLLAGPRTLMRFNITASPSGSVSVGTLNFSTAVSNVSFANPVLYAYSDPAHSVPVAGQGTTGGITATLGVTGNTFSMSPASPIVIPAGATYYFELRADISAIAKGPVGSSAPSYITTTFKGDSSYAGIGQWADQQEKGNFTWSPNTTSTAAYTNNDWTNGYGIPGLPAGGISQTVGTAPTTTPITPPHPILCPVGSHANYTTNSCDLDTGTPTTTPDTFAATPTSGTAPLSVEFNLHLSKANSSTKNTVYTIDFGDSHTEKINVCVGDTVSCRHEDSRHHTYTKAGTYTAVLIESKQCSITDSMKACTSTIAGSATITVVEKQKVATSTLSTSNTNATSSVVIVAPTCTLKANITTVKKGTPVTLTWTSTNATSASTQDGNVGSPQGSVKQTVDETTLFTKKVYGPGGEGSCTALVIVASTTQAAPDTKPATKVVFDSIGAYFGQTLSSMQVGAAVVGEGLSGLLFENSQ